MRALIRQISLGGWKSRKKSVEFLRNLGTMIARRLKADGCLSKCSTTNKLDGSERRQRNACWKKLSHWSRMVTRQQERGSKKGRVTVVSVYGIAFMSGSVAFTASSPLNMRNVSYLKRRLTTCLYHLIAESQNEIATTFTVSGCCRSYFHQFSTQFFARLLWRGYFRNIRNPVHI